MVNFCTVLVLPVAAAIGAGFAACGDDPATAPAEEAAMPVRPLIIAHSGASGYLPEHTLEAYALAIEQGADFIEPDLVITKDGVLIVRHENELSDTTDVAGKSPDRKTTTTFGESKIEGWFSEDFTLAEIKTLRANERVPSRNQSNNGEFEIPTFGEVLELRARVLEERGGILASILRPSTRHISRS